MESISKSVAIFQSSNNTVLTPEQIEGLNMGPVPEGSEAPEIDNQSVPDLLMPYMDIRELLNSIYSEQEEYELNEAIQRSVNDQ